MSARKDFAMPDLGEGLTESEIVSWHVSVGDTVSLNQVIAEIETAKALVELPSPFAGVVSRLYAEPGATVRVGAPIVAFDVDTESDSDDDQDPALSTEPDADGDAAPVNDAGAGGGATGRQSVLVGYGPEIETGDRPKRRPRIGDEGTRQSPGPANTAQLPEVAGSARRQEPEAASERPRSTPPVRRRARDLGVDLVGLHGTGPGGLITREDVESVAAGGVSESPSDSISDRMSPAGLTAGERAGEPGDRPPRETRIPIGGVRKHTAAAMVASAFTAPHVTEFLTVDVTPTMELIASLRARQQFRQTRLNILTVVAKALCLAVRGTPEVNARWDADAGEIVQFGYVNLGIAAATSRGLLVPTIEDADRMTLADLATALSELTETARAGRIPPARLTGGTITVTNVGVFGVDAGTPILNPGEAAILAMGAVRSQPWEYRGEIALRQVMTLSLSFDHRLVDGAQGSRFLAEIGAILAEPGYVLALA